jgi:hypothetical protein
MTKIKYNAHTLGPIIYAIDYRTQPIPSTDRYSKFYSNNNREMRIIPGCREEDLKGLHQYHPEVF